MAPPASKRPTRKVSRWRPVGNVLRWLLGAGSLVAGFTWMLINLSNPSALVDTLVGLVLVAGGLVLLMPHRIRLPRRVTWVVMTAVALVGTVAGLASGRATWSGYAYIAERGWPFHWAQRGAIAGDAETARRLTDGADWNLDLVALAGTLLFFAYVGLVLVVIVTLVRRSRRNR
jgi:xanthosine utilization system XapX-like protein